MDRSVRSPRGEWPLARLDRGSFGRIVRAGTQESMPDPLAHADRDRIADELPARSVRPAEIGGFRPPTLEALERFCVLDPRSHHAAPKVRGRHPDTRWAWNPDRATTL